MQHRIRSKSCAALLAAGSTLLAAFAFGQATSPQDPPAPPAVTPPAPEAQEAPAASRPFLYELQGHGARGYLFGTLHTADERVVKLAPSVEEAFVASSVVATEIETDAKAQAEFVKAAALPARETLEGAVGAELAGRVRAQLEARGLPRSMLDGLRPWAVNMMLETLDALPAMALRDPLDKALYERAKKEKKEVAGLETVAEQIAIFASLDAADQKVLLAEALDELDRNAAEGRRPIEELTLAWLSGDLSRLLDIMDEEFGDAGPLVAKLEKALVWDRNVRLAERIHARMKAAPAKVHFFAVGALHLPDARMPLEATDEERDARRGLVSLLAKHGYRVVRVAEAPVAEPVK